MEDLFLIDNTKRERDEEEEDLTEPNITLDLLTIWKHLCI